MPSEVLAPKLSVLRSSFERKDFDVVAIYIKTCGGSPDHAAEIGRQLTKHELDYRLLDGEAGKLDDPTRKRFPWAPHALLVDANGRVVQPYGHMPKTEEIGKDVRLLLATGVIPPRPDSRWRNFKRGAWVKLRFTGENPRIETRRLMGGGPSRLKLDVRIKTDVGKHTRIESSLPNARPVFRDKQLEHRELPATAVTIGGREYSCRLIERTWIRTTDSGKERYTQKSWVANDTGLPDRLLRQETRSRSRTAGVFERTRRIRAFSRVLAVGEMKLRCWVVETVAVRGTHRVETRECLSREVPGLVVESVQKVTDDGYEVKVSSRAIGFSRN